MSSDLIFRQRSVNSCKGFLNISTRGAWSLLTWTSGAPLHEVAVVMFFFAKRGILISERILLGTRSSWHHRESCGENLLPRGVGESVNKILVDLTEKLVGKKIFLLKGEGESTRFCWILLNLVPNKFPCEVNKNLVDSPIPPPPSKKIFFPTSFSVRSTRILWVCPS